MKFELARDWRYSGGQEGSPGGESLDEGTFLGTVDVAPGVPMTPDQLADAIRVKLAREVPEPGDKPVSKAASRRTAKVKELVADE